MGAERGFRTLLRVVEELQESGFAVNGVEIPYQQIFQNSELTAVLSVNLAMLRGVDFLQEVTVTDPDGSIDDGSRDLNLRLVIDCTGEEPCVSVDEEETLPLESEEIFPSADEEPDEEDESNTSPDPSTDPTNESADLKAEDSAVSGQIDGREREGRLAVEPAEDENDAVPAYQDPERLGEVYETCNTFEEMKDALGVDVSFQTVRRHMIRHGIHEPRTNGIDANGADTSEDQGETDTTDDREDTETSDDRRETETSRDRKQRGEMGNGETESERESSDGKEANEVDSQTKVSNSSVSEMNEEKTINPGTVRQTNDGKSPETHILQEKLNELSIELPTGLTLAQIRDAVHQSDTIYQTQQKLDLDEETTKRLLRELNLLQLVTGRLKSKPERELSRKEIDERIRVVSETIQNGQQSSSDD